MMNYLPQSNTIFAMNGDQNAFIYDIDQSPDKKINELTLKEQFSFYLDEIIDVKFVNGNK